MMPILMKELRGRMRGIGAPLTITLYVTLLALILYGMFAYVSRQVYFNGAQFAVLGLQLFWILNIFQLLLVAFIAPTLTAGAIAGEKERQTFDLLLSTRLSGFGILAGKLLAGIGYALLLIAVSSPLFAMAFIFGGVPMLLLIKALIVQVAWTVCLGTAGLFFSTVSRRSQAATALAVVLSLVLIFGTSILATFSPIYGKAVPLAKAVPMGKGMIQPVAPKVPFWYYLNPITGQTSAMAMQNMPVNIPIPIPYLNMYSGNPGQTPLWRVQMYGVAGATVVLFLLSWMLLDPRPFGRRRTASRPAERPAAGA